jgi:hypothetical protein
MIPTDEKLIDDFKKIIRIHHLKMYLFHQMEGLKHEFKDKIEAYQEIERVIEPESKQENTKESVKEMEFLIEKENKNWIISRPGNPADIQIIPPEILTQITSSNVEPGIRGMVNNFKTKNGKIVNFTFERWREDCFTCSIIDKCSENETKQAKEETPSKQAGDTPDKKDNLRKILTYLLEFEPFYNSINEQFREQWKPLIDDGFIKRKSSKANLL